MPTRPSDFFRVRILGFPFLGIICFLAVVFLAGGSPNARYFSKSWFSKIVRDDKCCYVLLIYLLFIFFEIKFRQDLEFFGGHFGQKHAVLVRLLVQMVIF